MLRGVESYILKVIRIGTLIHLKVLTIHWYIGQKKAMPFLNLLHVVLVRKALILLLSLMNSHHMLRIGRKPMERKGHISM